MEQNSVWKGNKPVRTVISWTVHKQLATSFIRKSCVSYVVYISCYVACCRKCVTGNVSTLLKWWRRSNPGLEDACNGNPSDPYIYNKTTTGDPIITTRLHLYYSKCCQVHFGHFVLGTKSQLTIVWPKCLQSCMGDNINGIGTMCL